MHTTDNYCEILPTCFACVCPQTKKCCTSPAQIGKFGSGNYRDKLSRRVELFHVSVLCSKVILVSCSKLLKASNSLVWPGFRCCSRQTTFPGTHGKKSQRIVLIAHQLLVEASLLCPITQRILSVHDGGGEPQKCDEVL